MTQINETFKSNWKSRPCKMQEIFTSPSVCIVGKKKAFLLNVYKNMTFHEVRMQKFSQTHHWWDYVQIK